MALSVGELMRQTTASKVSGSSNPRACTRVVEVARPSSLGLSASSSGVFGNGSISESGSPSPLALRAQSHGWSSSRCVESEFGVSRPRGATFAGGHGVSSSAIRAGPPESATPVIPSKSSKKKYPGESKGFVEEMRFVAMKLHTKDQSKEGEKEDKNVQPVAKWQPTVEGYLKFLSSSKKVYETLEEIVQTASHPSYAEFRNTGLERSARLAKDLEWFQSQGHEIPPVGEEGTKYAELLRNISETDPPAFICHFYNIYFAHSAGGRFIGQKVADSVIDGRVLEFYKWDGDLQTLLANVKAKLNATAQNWTRDEKNHCLEETELSFKYSGKLLRLIVS